jgi:hypothetical protein
MSDERMVKDLYKWKHVKKTVRKTKNRWEDGIRNDMKKVRVKD